MSTTPWTPKSIGAIAASCIWCVAALAENTNPAKPNVLLIYADDLGYGDVRAFANVFGTGSVAPTPRMDALASQGMMLTHMYSGSAVCSPSRYGLLTGRYPWRLQGDGVLMSGAVGNYGQPIIRQGELTLAKYLRNRGYETAAFGKWHLGAQFYNRQGVAFSGNSSTVTSPSQIDLARRIEGHAIDQGFDTFFGALATINQPPYAYMVNDRVQFNGAPATSASPWVMIQSSQLEEGPTGVGDPNITQQQYGPNMMTRARDYLAARSSQSTPFFAYIAMYSPHLPFLPTAGFVGSSGQANFPYGDYICQTDHWIGQLIDALGASANNTIVIVASDNGPETGPYGQARGFGQDSNGPFKGVKRDSWEGGVRAPFILRWPGKVAAGSRSSVVLWQGDLFATLAEYLGVAIPEGQAPDSQSFLWVLRNTPKPSPSRDFIVTASDRNQLSITGVGGWKLIDGTGGGGNPTSYDANNVNLPNARGTIGGTPKQLYYLPQDTGERTNREATDAVKRNELMDRLNAYRNSESSVP